jgi:Na+/citrate or Na+/malate symporter
VVVVVVVLVVVVREGVAASVFGAFAALLAFGALVAFAGAAVPLQAALFALPAFEQS